jgi:DNA gyrase subunit A
MLFTNHGRVYRIKGYEIPETSRTSKGTNVVNIIPVSPDEKITAMIKVPDFGTEEAYLAMVTKKGIIKRTDLDAYKNIRKGGIIAINLDEGDELGWVCLTHGNDILTIAKKFGKAITFCETEARLIGRTARGVRAVKLLEGDEVIGADIMCPDKLVLVVSETGFGCLSASAEYKPQGRSGYGPTYYKAAKYGNVVSLQSVDNQNDLIIITESGMMVRIPIGSITPHSKGSKGVKIMNLAEGDRIISAVAVARADEEPDAGEEDGGEAPVSGEITQEAQETQPEE